jgi:hypothetical protein
MKNKIVLGLCLLSALAITSILVSKDKASHSETYTVLTIQDNLTLRIGNGKHQRQVKLCGVNISDNQKLEAKNLILEELKLVENIVFVTLKGNKAEVFLTTDSDAEKMLSEELLVNGLAKLTQDNCPNQITLETAESIAKQNKVGIWK